MHMKRIIEDNASKLMHALSILSAIAGIVTLVDSLLKSFETSILQLLAGMLGITILGSFVIPAWLTLMLLLVSSGYLLWSTRRSENRREGIAQLADACCIQTLGSLPWCMSSEGGRSARPTLSTPVACAVFPLTLLPLVFAWLTSIHAMAKSCAIR